MHLKPYIKQKRGLAASLGRTISVNPVLISQWARGIRPIPAEHCLSIEKATSGEVRCEDLRPDVDWAYLRGTAPTKTPTDAKCLK